MHDFKRFSEERALVQQQRFMTDLTHELRTPLAIVSGNLQRIGSAERSPGGRQLPAHDGPLVSS